MRELLRSEPLRHPEVVPLIMVGLAVDRPLRAISFLASWKDYWGASALLPRGRVILPHLPVRALATRGPQLCVRQSPELTKGMLRHQKLWGCLLTWTFITRRVSSKCRGISYHQFSWTHSSSLRWLRLCLSWQSLQWCRRYFLQPIATRLVRSTSTRERWAQTGVLKSGEPVPSTSQPTQQVQEQISEASNINSDGADEPPPEREPPR